MGSYIRKNDEEHVVHACVLGWGGACADVFFEVAQSCGIFVLWGSSPFWLQMWQDCCMAE